MWARAGEAEGVFFPEEEDPRVEKRRSSSSVPRGVA